MLKNFFNFVNLHSGEASKQKVLEEVKDNISFRNANLWILVCAILIASIGLNINSTAVIIGAMLISPLMGPIVAAGFALGTYDFALLKRAAKNILIATVASLIVATIYFLISPFKETQSELMSRTSPNIYDVLIAFLGGVVGVISLTRVNKGNPIPGVAIATALMPPLCTAGYGLAVGNFQYFLGAFYLYAINCFFICIATFVITKYLKYPPVTTIDAKYDKRIQRAITITILLMIIPSFYLAYDLYREKKYIEKVEEFINDEFVSRGYTIIYKSTKLNTNPKSIELAFLKEKFDKTELKLLNSKLHDAGIENTVLNIKQDVRDIKGEILKEIDGQKIMLSAKDIEIERLKTELATYKVDDTTLYKEISLLFPEIYNISLGQHLTNFGTDSAKVYTVFIFSLVNKRTSPDIEKLHNWLALKMNTNNIKVVCQD